MNLDVCRECPRLGTAAKDAIECAPPPSDRSLLEALPGGRLGADACVGDAMGYLTVSVHADVPSDVVLGALDRVGATIAVVADDDERLVGLLDGTDLALKVAPVAAGRIARWVGPVHEAAPLDHAVDRMVRERARALPVIDDHGCIVAMLSDLDALRWVSRRPA